MIASYFSDLAHGLVRGDEFARLDQSIAESIVITVAIQLIEDGLEYAPLQRMLWILVAQLGRLSDHVCWA